MVDSTNEVADTTGLLHQRIKKGFYAFRFDPAAMTLECERSSPSNGGVHEGFWETFATEVEQLRERVLLSLHNPQRRTGLHTRSWETWLQFLRVIRILVVPGFPRSETKSTILI